MLTVFLLVFLFLKDGVPMPRIDNICSKNGIQRILLGLGESGVLTASNVPTADRNGSWYDDCQVDIVTCPSCAISLTFRYMNLSCYCRPTVDLFLYNPCRCDYVWIVEPPYLEASGVSFCKIVPAKGSKTLPKYKSKTRMVRVTFVYTLAHKHAFTLEYISEPNRQLFFGSSGLGLNLSTRFISSPFFPTRYPRDLVTEYVLTCVAPSSSVRERRPDPECRIRLLFSDFQMATTSTMEFYDGVQQVNMINGSAFRPPVLVTSTNSLKIRFYANGESGLGFKASFAFVSEEAARNMAKPTTDCGGSVENLGGTITMMKMVNKEMRLYDCVWLIRPSEDLFRLNTHLYLKVSTFLDFEGNAELEIREGMTSNSPILNTLRYPVMERFREHVRPLNSGYYVSLKAFFGPASYLAIAYASFGYKRCYALSDFLCRNRRCISRRLTCDGFDHCGDNSDEPEVCYPGWRVEPSVGRWHTQTPNYYFPKVKAESEWNVANILLFVSLLGFAVATSAFTICLFRLGSRSHQRRTLHEQLQSISELLDGLSDEVYVEDISVDEPPCYEPPPNYEDVVKSSKLEKQENSHSKSGRQQLPLFRNSSMVTGDLILTENSNPLGQGSNSASSFKPSLKEENSSLRKNIPNGSDYSGSTQGSSLEEEGEEVISQKTESTFLENGRNLLPEWEAGDLSGVVEGGRNVYTLSESCPNDLFTSPR